MTKLADLRVTFLRVIWYNPYQPCQGVLFLDPYLFWLKRISGKNFNLIALSSVTCFLRSTKQSEASAEILQSTSFRSD